MMLMIEISKEGIVDKLNVFIESFQQLQLDEYKDGTITYDEEKENEVEKILDEYFLLD